MLPRRRLLTLALSLAVLAIAGCSTVRDEPTHPACQGRPDADSCREALAVALTVIPDGGDGYAITVAPVTCDGGRCSTWVTGTPIGGACRPSWDIELVRSGGVPWTVGMLSHGDPACAFD